MSTILHEVVNFLTLVSCKLSLGFEILAFPCNQFAGQEPGTNDEIQETVCTRFKAEFPVFDKVISDKHIVIGKNVSLFFIWSSLLCSHFLFPVCYSIWHVVGCPALPHSIYSRHRLVGRLNILHIFPSHILHAIIFLQ